MNGVACTTRPSGPHEIVNRRTAALCSMHSAVASNTVIISRGRARDFIMERGGVRDSVLTESL